MSQRLYFCSPPCLPSIVVWELRVVGVKSAKLSGDRSSQWPVLASRNLLVIARPLWRPIRGRRREERFVHVHLAPKFSSRSGSGTERGKGHTLYTRNRGRSLAIGGTGFAAKRLASGK